MRGARHIRVIAVLGALATVLPASAAAAHGAPARHARHVAAALSLAGTYAVQGQAVTVPGRSVTVQGVVRPYARGQHVTVFAWVEGRQLLRERLLLRRSRGGGYGWFTVRLSSPQVGQVIIQAKHDGDTSLPAFAARATFTALDDHVGFGSTGRFVELLQERLAALHLYIPQTGVYDQGTGLALDAYHRLLRWGTYQTLDSATVTWLLNGWGAFPVRYPGDGRHAEGNLTLQLLALIDHGQVQLIYPISSGKPSTPTILGRFRVYRRAPGYLPDGMYYSDFFISGYAIHGYNPAPDYPASHGCMRIPIVDAISAYDWLAIGDGVDTYY